MKRFEPILKLICISLLSSSLSPLLAKKIDRKTACIRLAKSNGAKVQEDLFPPTTDLDCKGRAEALLLQIQDAKKKKCLIGKKWIHTIAWKNGNSSKGELLCPFNSPRYKAQQKKALVVLKKGDRKKLMKMILNRKYKKYRKRLRALLLASKGYPVNKITRKLKMKKNTLKAIIVRYNTKGLSGLVKK